MGQFYREFSGEVAGSFPAGLTRRWNAASGYSVANDGGVNRLRIMSTNYLRTGVSYDAPGSAADQEAYVQLRMTATTAYAGVTLRGGGSDDTRSGYSAFFRPDNGRVDIWRHSGNTNVALGSITMSLSVGVVYALRFKVSGSTLSCRAWAVSGAEPSGWGFTTTDTTFASGWSGFFAPMNAGAVYIYGLGVGTAGDAAPTALVATAPKLSLQADTRVFRAGSWLSGRQYLRVGGVWRGYTGTAATRLYDEFTGADGTLVTSRPLNVGGSWTSRTGTQPSLSGNKLVLPPSYSLITADAVASDGVVSVTATPGSTRFFGLVFRFVDVQNYWNLWCADAGKFDLYENSGGSSYLRQSANYATAQGSSYLLKVVLSGPSIEAFVGTTRLFGYTSSFNQNAKHFGLRANNGATFDDFLMTS